MNFKKIPGKFPIITTLFLSAAMQLTPQLASKNSDDYLNDNDYPEALADNFETDKIRVYGRYNPLSTLHFTGRPLALHLNDLPDDNMELLTDSVMVPLHMLLSGFTGIKAFLPPYTAADAYAVPDENGTCFIRPPSSDTSLSDVLSVLSDISEIGDSETFNLKNDLDVIEDAFRTMIMAHEMRHCSHDLGETVSNLNESDADIVALRVLGEAGYAPEVIEETYKLYVAARLTSGLNWNESHDTGPNIINGNTAYMNSLKTVAAQRILNDLVTTTVKKHDFPDEMSRHEKRFQAVVALNANSVLDEFDPDVKDYAYNYIRAYLYLNRVADEEFLKHRGYFKNIDTEFLYDDLERETIPTLQDFGYEF